MRILLAAAALALTAALPVAAMAEETPQLVIKDHRFQPERLEVPAGVKFKLMVRNDDDSAEEFESYDLHREKVVPPKQEIPVFIGPLSAGEYKFFGDFHQDSAHGVMVAR